jgi:hypothetical protein
MRSTSASPASVAQSTRRNGARDEAERTPPFSPCPLIYRRRAPPNIKRGSPCVARLWAAPDLGQVVVMKEFEELRFRKSQMCEVR